MPDARRTLALASDATHDPEDAMWRRTTTAATLALTTALAFGCGGTDRTPEDRDVARARAALEAWYGHLGHGRVEEACGLLTAAARRRLTRDRGALGFSCEGELAATLWLMTDPEREGLRGLEVGQVEVSGDRARVLNRDHRAPRGFGPVLEPVAVTTLRKVGGVWKIEALPS